MPNVPSHIILQFEMNIKALQSRKYESQNMKDRSHIKTGPSTRTSR